MHHLPLQILLIEDNPDHIDLFKTYLLLTEFDTADVFATDTMKQAFVQLKLQTPDLIFLDLSLTDSVIEESLKSIKILGKYAPVIVITSLDDSRTILDIINRGADDCLPKSELKDTLLERIIRFNLDRWQLKQKLLKSEQEYLDLYDNSPEMYVSVDAKTALVRVCNQTLADKLGYTKAEIIGQPIFSLYHPDSMDGARTAFNSFVTKGSVENAELQLIRKDHSKIEVLLNVSAVRDDQGNILYSRSTWTDISEKKRLEETLKLLQYALDFVKEAAFLINQQSEFEYINEQACTNLGYTKEELLSMKVSDIDPNYTLEDWPSFWKSMISNTDISLFESSHLRKDGSEYLIEIIASMINYKGTNHILAFVRDVTERKHTEQVLRQAASVFSHANEGIMITDADCKIQDVNSAFTAITGYSSKDVVGQNPSILSSGKLDDSFYQNMWDKLNKGENWYGEILNRRKNGELYTERLAINVIKDDNDEIKNYIGMFSDITVLKEQQHQLEQIAHFDALTKLPNRVLLSDRLHQLMVHTVRQTKNLAVVYLDLDGFKEINDRHGHSVGDEFLIRVANRLNNSLREGDTIARIGGDEFIAVLPDLTEHTDCIPLLERLLTAVSTPVDIDGITLQVSASIGATFYPQAEATDADQLLRQADHAMYQAKQSGKNRFKLFDQIQEEEARKRHKLIQKIHQALLHDEFTLYYQPKVNMRTGKILGVEALLRWQQPDGKLILPNEFLPLIENDPVIINVDNWVLLSAMTQFKTWSEEYQDIPVSINISALSLQQKNFTLQLNSMLESMQINPGSIEIEVIETNALQDISLVSEIISQCKKMGVQFAMDDFGTGYSSLAYLKRLPVKILKIDQAFVRNLLEDAEDLAILESILGIAESFARNVVAEGVESEDHCKLLLQIGCDIGQGYGIAHPMPAEKVIQWCKSWRPNSQWSLIKKLHRDNHELLYAIIEHRAWVKAIEKAANGKTGTSPPLDTKQCFLGRWLSHSGSKHFDSINEYQSMVALHDEIHQVGKEIMSLDIANSSVYRQEKLNKLYQLRDQIIHRLQALID
ncbi:MAG: EAL domain-containing protein [Candidatus Thiodiazotropha taylori]|nr:EAL domain-containing protein [Candidatus Thiodiazotropha taylori]